MVECAIPTRDRAPRPGLVVVSTHVYEMRAAVVNTVGETITTRPQRCCDGVILLCYRPLTLLKINSRCCFSILLRHVLLAVQGLADASTFMRFPSRTRRHGDSDRGIKMTHESIEHGVLDTCWWT